MIKMSKIQDFTDLIVWQKSHKLVLNIYRITQKFPSEEKFGLVNQIRRAAVSVPANIAEGFKKRGRADKARFMNIGEGSTEECRYYLILSRDLGYGYSVNLMTNLEEVSKLLRAYASSILHS